MAEEKQEETYTLKMVYFPFSARGQPLRLAAAYGGIKLEERCISFEEQAKEKSEGQRRWTGVPELFILDKDGKEIANIGQSNTCLRYIGMILIHDIYYLYFADCLISKFQPVVLCQGKQTGLYPTDAIDAALVDEVLDSVEDLCLESSKLVFAKDFDDKKAKAIEFCKEDGTLRYWLDKFLLRIEENKKKENKNGLFVGDSLTIADLKFNQFEFYLIRMVPGAQDVLNEDKYKPLMANMDYVKNNDKIKAFLDEWENRKYVKQAFDGLKKAKIIVI